MKPDYKQEAFDDSRYFIEEYRDEIFEMLRDKEEASTDLYNDYVNGDAFVHENYTDKYYSLIEAAHLLEDLDEWKETDHGLWYGLETVEAVTSQAAYTYTNAVHHFITERIRRINDDYDSEMTDEEVKNLIEEEVKS